jgi:hypothetical protein
MLHKKNPKEELTLYTAASYSLSADAMAGLVAISRKLAASIYDKNDRIPTRLVLY